MPLEYLNLLILPVLAWAIMIERRLMRIELTIQIIGAQHAPGAHRHRRHDDPTEE